MIIFEWSLKLADGEEPKAVEDIGSWLQRQLAGIGWPPARVYHNCCDRGMLRVECRFEDLDSFEAVWPKFESAKLGHRLGSDLGLRLEAASECRQLYSTQYVRSAVDEI